MSNRFEGMYQDSEGKIPVTETGQKVGYVKMGRLIQCVNASRPTAERIELDDDVLKFDNKDDFVSIGQVELDALDNNAENEVSRTFFPPRDKERDKVIKKANELLDKIERTIKYIVNCIKNK